MLQNSLIGEGAHTAEVTCQEYALLIPHMNSIILPDISLKWSLILGYLFKIGPEIVFCQLYEINTSL